MQKLPDTERKKHIAFRAHPSVIRALMKLAKQQGVPYSRIVQDAVEIHLRDRKMLGDR